MDRQSTLFSFCVGGLALMSTIASIALFLRGYLPSTQMKVLDELFQETHSIFEKAIEDGLLPDETFRIGVRHKLADIDYTREILREAACQATTSLDDIKALLRGVSKEIMDLTTELKQLRRYVTTTSQTERVKRRHQVPSVTSVPLSERSATESLPESFGNSLPLALNAHISVPLWDDSQLPRASNQPTRCALCLLAVNGHSGSTVVSPSGDTNSSESSKRWPSAEGLHRAIRHLRNLTVGRFSRRSSRESSEEHGHDQLASGSTSESDPSSYSLSPMNDPPRRSPHYYWRNLPKSHSAPDLILETQCSDQTSPRPCNGGQDGYLDIAALLV